MGAQAQAMQSAAKNEGGAFTGFLGMNMAQSAGGMNTPQNLFQLGMQQQSQQVSAEDRNNPQPLTGWTCACGGVNKGKFCSECGEKKPVGAPLYQCDKCGWQPEDPIHPPKFCPECGDVFNEYDLK